MHAETTWVGRPCAFAKGESRDEDAKDNCWLVHGLFFLWYGLAAFVPALAGGFFLTLAGLLALGVAVFTFLGM
jgi:hypothetical protein